jgi:hypothetical protein
MPLLSLFHPSGDFEEVAEAVCCAEAVGFHGCFFGEHHGSPGMDRPQLLVLLAALAARTRSIRLGTSILRRARDQLGAGVERAGDLGHPWRLCGADSELVQCARLGSHAGDDSASERRLDASGPAGDDSPDRRASDPQAALMAELIRPFARRPH